MVGGNNGERTSPGASHPQVALQQLEQTHLGDSGAANARILCRDNRNNITMLRLGHDNGGTALLPGIIFLEHRAEDHRILVLSNMEIPSEMVS